MQAIASATESLLISASSLNPTDERSLVNTLTSYLESIYDIFGGQIRRLDILMPAGDTLISKARHRMPEENVPNLLNDKTADQGIFVYAFNTGEIEIAHFYEEDGDWKCDYPRYKLHRPLNRKPPHTTFVVGNVPGSV